MAALSVEVPTPVLIFGEGEQLAGEVWLTNSSGGEVKITGALLKVDFPQPETGPIALPDEVVMRVGATRRLTIRSGMPAYTPPGTFPAKITVQTSVGDQAIPASVVIAAVVNVGLAPSVTTLTGATSSSTHTVTVLVANRGNVPVAVGTIPAETLQEMVSVPRVLEVSGGTVRVEPAVGTAPGGAVTFASTPTTVPPAGWVAVDVLLTLPATLPADRHFRLLPRIANTRFVVDLLT